MGTASRRVWFSSCSPFTAFPCGASCAGARGAGCERARGLGARGGPCPRLGSQRALSLQVIAELQGTVSSLREDSSRQQLAAERRLQDVARKFEDEKQQLIRENERAVQVRRFRVAAGGRGGHRRQCPARPPASRALGSDEAGPARPRACGDRPPQAQRARSRPMPHPGPAEPPLARASALAPLAGERTGSPRLPALCTTSPRLQGSEAPTPALWRPRLRRPVSPWAGPDLAAENVDEASASFGV